MARKRTNGAKLARRRSPPPATRVRPRGRRDADLLRGPQALESWRDAVTQARARGEASTLALLDVDGMAAHVRALGGARADALLRGVVDRLRSVLTDQALLGRWAGDLFGVALPGVDVEPALGLLERARAAVADRPFRVGRGKKDPEGEPREARVTVSIGLAGLPRDGRDLPTLLDAARAALWRAKSLGGNRLGLPARERMVLKTSYYAHRQLEQLKRLAARLNVSEAVLLRDGLEELLLRYKEPGVPVLAPTAEPRRPAVAAGEP